MTEALNQRCDSPTSSLMSVESALEHLLRDAHPVPDEEICGCADALGRVVARPQKAAIDVPPWDNSAMDGYAVRTRDIQRGTDSPLPLSQRIPAGCSPRPLQPGTVARIFTGAPMPSGADAVVIQEACRTQGSGIVIGTDVAAGDNVRRAGEDLRRGDVVLEPGTRLGPQHLGVAASVGIERLAVYRRVRVAVFTSGSELMMPGEPLVGGKIYNSNRFTLTGLLQGLGCEMVDLGSVPDTLEATCDALRRGAASADLVLASGGVSVGEEDHVKRAVESTGHLALWRIAVRPGKPLAAGRVDGTPFIGMPGNPVSVFVSFCLFARPFILKLQGCTAVAPLSYRVAAGFDWPRPDKRREYVRARLRRDGRGEARLDVFPSRSSGVLNSVVWANGLAVIPEARPIRVGDPVEFLPFTELLG